MNYIYRIGLIIYLLITTVQTINAVDLSLSLYFLGFVLSLTLLSFLAGRESKRSLSSTWRKKL